MGLLTLKRLLTLPKLTKYVIVNYGRKIENSDLKVPIIIFIRMLIV